MKSVMDHPPAWRIGCEPKQFEHMVMSYDEEKLLEVGNDGWRLVAVSDDHMFFVREVQEPEPVRHRELGSQP